MKNNYNDHVTGDPFVDNGRLVLEFLQEKNPNKSLNELITMVTKVYVVNWEGKLHSFFLNSTITHKTNNTVEKKTSKTITYYTETIYNSMLESGYCRICGQMKHLSPTGRDNYCLCGSNTYVNFHHALEKGFMLCADCLTAIFLAPLATYQGKNLILLQPNSEGIRIYIKNKIISNNYNKYFGTNLKGGFLSPAIKNPNNAIIKVAGELIDLFIDTDKENPTENITINSFSNFATSPQIDIINLPSNIYTFLYKMSKAKLRSDWNQFIYKYYKVSKATWNNENNNWVDKRQIKISEEIIENSYNTIIHNLINEKSILSYIRNDAKHQYQNKKSVLKSEIIYLYITEVLDMQTKTINILKAITNSIFVMMQENNDQKRVLTQLESTKTAHELRRVILLLIKKNYQKGNQDPLITLDDYVNYLFPDGQYWSEIRDLMLIYLYEKMHEENLRIEIDNNDIEIPDEQEVKEY